MISTLSKCLLKQSADVVDYVENFSTDCAALHIPYNLIFTRFDVRTLPFLVLHVDTMLVAFLYEPARGEIETVE